MAVFSAEALEAVNLGQRWLTIIFGTTVFWNMRTMIPNVRKRPARDEDEEPLMYIPVAVRFGNIPPRIFLVTRNGKTQLTEDTVGTLDHAEISPDSRE